MIGDPTGAWGIDAALSGLVEEGHYLYESGDHGELWIAVEVLYAEPRNLRAVAARLAEALDSHGASAVVAPAIGGALLGVAVAAELGTEFLYACAPPGSRPGHARPAISPAVGDRLAGGRAVVLDDVIAGASSALACVREVGRWGGEVVAIGCVVGHAVACTELGDALGLDSVALVEASWGVWPPGDCPRCRRGEMVDERF